jgi:hypothetical protein
MAGAVLETGCDSSSGLNLSAGRDNFAGAFLEIRRRDCVHFHGLLVRGLGDESLLVPSKDPGFGWTRQFRWPILDPRQ